MSKLHTLLVTGGHPTPALAVIDALRVHRPRTRIVFVGRRTANEKEKSQTYEYQEISQRGLEFIHSTAKRGDRGLLELPYQIIKNIFLLNTVRPNAVLSFGGYISVPVCIAAYLLRIPFFLHEQTLQPGSANIRLARFACGVMVSYPQTMHHFKHAHVVCTGNPIRQSFRNHSSGKNVFSHLASPIIFILGGNLGSHAINMHVFNLLPKLLTDFSVIHQVGNIKQYNDWDKAMQHHVGLSPELARKYLPIEHLNSHDISQAYQVADLVVSRSGASTTTELIARKKPAVLIPLPWSAYGEQKKHALLLADAHAAIIFDQDKPSDELFACIQTMHKNVQSYSNAYDSIAHFYDPQATQKIIRTLEKALVTGCNV